MYGVREFSAIINPPQATIFAIGAAERRPVEVKGGGIRFVTKMTVTVSLRSPRRRWRARRRAAGDLQGLRRAARHRARLSAPAVPRFPPRFPRAWRRPAPRTPSAPWSRAIASAARSVRRPPPSTLRRAERDATRLVPHDFRQIEPLALLMAFGLHRRQQIDAPPAATARADRHVGREAVDEHRRTARTGLRYSSSSCLICSSPPAGSRIPAPRPGSAARGPPSTCAHALCHRLAGARKAPPQHRGLPGASTPAQAHRARWRSCGDDRCPPPAPAPCAATAGTPRPVPPAPAPKPDAPEPPPRDRRRSANAARPCRLPIVTRCRIA